MIQKIVPAKNTCVFVIKTTPLFPEGYIQDLKIETLHFRDLISIKL